MIDLDEDPWELPPVPVWLKAYAAVVAVAGLVAGGTMLYLMYALVMWVIRHG